jgi:hypothetical protein
VITPVHLRARILLADLSGFNTLSV